MKRWSPGIWGKHGISIYICTYINNTENPLPLLSNIQNDRQDHSVSRSGVHRPCSLLTCATVRTLHLPLYLCLPKLIYVRLCFNSANSHKMNKWLKILAEKPDLEINLSRHEKRAQLTSALFLVGTVSQYKNVSFWNRMFWKGSIAAVFSFSSYLSTKQTFQLKFVQLHLWA